MKTGPGEILSYGEDPLTYYALSSRLDEVLSQLDDGSHPGSTMVIYRPSFGRGVGAHRSKRHATFGEFDAVLATPEAAYLIESKWQHSPEVKGATVRLREVQVIRHEILRWYRLNWRPEYFGDWKAFVNACAGGFKRRFRLSCMAPAGSKLQKNLEFVLSRLVPYGQDTRDVVLYVCPYGTEPLRHVQPRGFQPVTIHCDMLNEMGLLNMRGGRQRGPG
jgi:hypothetical protein